MNFSLWSPDATGVELLLFDRRDRRQPAAVVALDPAVHRTDTYWHVAVSKVRPGTPYAFRVDGTYRPEDGLRFDRSKLLLDPYAKGVIDDDYDRGLATRFGESNLGAALLGVVVDPGGYDWEGDEPLRRPFRGGAIYETHVRGFTQHPSSGVRRKLRGTYAGMIEKIPHLQRLGIEAVELLPVYQFDPYSAPGGRQNYWGYEPVSFFAPHRAYSSDRTPTGPITEFRNLVKALHRAGIEVILDVVYNHTAEDGADGPTISLRGIANDAYYLLPADDRSGYIDDSGVGNTVNGNHTVVRRLIVDSLRYWVQHMHVDGFRFDLASVLSRGEDSIPLADPPILWDIDTDPVLAGTKIIAEAWDAAGLYQVGSFAGDRWAVWNGRYRDTVRQFVKGDDRTVVGLADAMPHRTRRCGPGTTNGWLLASSTRSPMKRSPRMTGSSNSTCRSARSTAPSTKHRAEAQVPARTRPTEADPDGSGRCSLTATASRSDGRPTGEPSRRDLVRTHPGRRTPARTDRRHRHVAPRSRVRQRTRPRPRRRLPHRRSGLREEANSGNRPRQAGCPVGDALADRTHQLVAVELRPTPPQHRPAHRTPPGPTRPRNRPHHHDQTDRLAQPLEPYSLSL